MAPAVVVRGQPAACALANGTASVARFNPIRHSARISTPFLISCSIRAWLGGTSLLAVAHYREAIRINPTLAAAHNDLAITLADTGHIPEAVDSAARALVLARVAGQTTLAGALKARVQRYRDGRSLRETAP